MEKTSYFDNDFNFEEWSKECEEKYSLIEIGRGRGGRNEKSNFSFDWEDFYNKHETGQFFKIRKYLCHEFKQWLERTQLLLEVGCGYGCSIYPLLDNYSNIKFIATDYSECALNIFKQNKKFDSTRITVLKWDVTLPIILEQQVDAVLMVFALSAVHPRNHLISLLNIYEQLTEGSFLLFRDYGIHDMTMYRHNIRHDDKLYERSDGTLSYYFDIDYFTSLAIEANFEVIEIKYATVINKNRKTKVEMKRVFLHAVLQKKLSNNSTILSTDNNSKLDDDSKNNNNNDSYSNNEEIKDSNMNSISNDDNYNIGEEKNDENIVS